MDTFLSDAEGQNVCADTKDSSEVHENDKLTLKVPADDKVNSDCDATTANVTWDAPWASSTCEFDGCDPQQEKCYEVDLDCFGVDPNNNPYPQEVVRKGGILPQGTSQFECWATSNICGDSIHEGWTVTVNDTVALDVAEATERSRLDKFFSCRGKSIVPLTARSMQ